MVSSASIRTSPAPLTLSLSLMTIRIAWTSEELVLLQRLARANFSLQIIALTLGRSVAAVEDKAVKHQILIRWTKRLDQRTPIHVLRLVSPDGNDPDDREWTDTTAGTLMGA